MTCCLPVQHLCIYPRPVRPRVANPPSVANPRQGREGGFPLLRNTQTLTQVTPRFCYFLVRRTFQLGVAGGLRNRGGREDDDVELLKGGRS